ncbi:MAG: protease modulator HflK, partial [Pontixanthobacter sp.]
MSTIGAFAKNIGLAMAGKNPWGGKSDGSDGGDGADAGSGGDDKPSGPRNPWLPGGSGGDEPRRSANIEDIFKRRGPEGPRKGGGGPGGPNFRFPERPGGKSWLPVALVLVAGVG